MSESGCLYIQTFYQPAIHGTFFSKIINELHSLDYNLTYVIEISEIFINNLTYVIEMSEIFINNLTYVIEMSEIFINTF